MHIAIPIAGAAMALSGIVIVLMARRFGSGGVLICPRGLVFAKSGTVDALAWEQIRSIRQSGDSAAAQTIQIESKDGKTTSIDAARVGDMERFTMILRRESDRKRIPWTAE
jgi:hypothetical protein